jgi:hypothetical protein
MHTIYSLNVSSTIPFFISVLRGQKPFVLDVAPAVPRLAAPLHRLVKALIEKGKARDIRELVPEFIPELDYDQRVHFHDVFAAIEPWQAEYFEFKRFHDFMPAYSRTFRHVTSLHLSQRLATLLVIPSLLGKLPETARIIGLSADIAEAAAHFGKTGIDSRIIQSHPPRRLINAVQSLLLLIASMTWALSRIRFPVRTPKPVFFAVDYISDIADDNLIGEIKEGGDILLVARTSAYLRNIKNSGMPHTACLSSDGFLEPVEAVRLIGRLVKEIVSLYIIEGGKSPALFYRLIPMPLRRAEYQALFNRYRPQVYWGRDVYDPRHILRRPELHRHGGESWSICHSYLTYGTSYPEFRHLAFDRYYVLGRGFYEFYFKETWNHDIKVIGASSFRISRDAFRSRLQEKPHDILVMCSSFLMEPGLVELVRTLAKNFPDRIVHLQVKSPFLNTVEGQTFIEACREGLENVILATDNFYTLFGKARYVFSDPSSAAMEAPQFGVYTLVTDISPTRKPSILLEVPEFSVTSGRQAVERIQGIESGRWHYPIEEIEKFVDLSGQVFCDRIRQDLGMPALEKSQPAWPNLEKTIPDLAS